MTIFIGFINIIAGLALMLILSHIQGFLLGILLGGAFIALNFSRFSVTLYNRIIYSAVIPLVALFSITVFMTAMDPNVPPELKTPIPVGLIILLSIWTIIILNLRFSKITCHSHISNKNYSIWTKAIMVSVLILGISCIGFGIFSLPVSISRYAKGLPLRFWVGFGLIFTGVLKMRILKHVFLRNLQNISLGFLLVGILDALIGYAFFYHVSKSLINLYLIIFCIMPAIYFLKGNRK